MRTRLEESCRRALSRPLACLGFMLFACLSSLALIQAADDKPKPKRQDTEVGKLLTRLDAVQNRAGQDEWSIVLRDMILLGPKAVPELIVEMDAAKSDMSMRCLAFVLRGIGDKRAIPCLIRAIPRSCIRPGSDMGYRANDPKLLAFMQEHDTEGKVGGSHFSFGRPINEIRAALQKLSGAKHGEDEIVHVFLEGTPRQQYLQRALYQRCAERWAAWWELHAKEYVDDPAYAHIALTPLAAPASLTRAFPQGPQVQVDGSHSNHILESVLDPKSQRVFLDLDTGRSSKLPDYLRAAAGNPERLDDIVAWAAREGYDLMCTQYTPPGGKQSHYVLRGLGLTLWQIETDGWKSIETDIHESKPLNMGLRTEGILARFDSLRGRYVPDETATFLFQTREGGYGAIFVGVEVYDDSQKPGGFSQGNDELNPVAFHKGRRFAYTLVSGPEERSAKREAEKPMAK
jgi:hypothetical protein